MERAASLRHLQPPYKLPFVEPSLTPFFNNQRQSHCSFYQITPEFESATGPPLLSCQILPSLSLRPDLAAMAFRGAALAALNVAALAAAQDNVYTNSGQLLPLTGGRAH